MPARIVVLLSLVSGCALVHEADTSADGGTDAARTIDASRDVLDVGSSPDLGPIDDVGVLPPDPEPDGAVDVPPDAWRADGSTPSGVFLTPIGLPIDIDDSGLPPGERAGAPQLAWNGEGWGVLWYGAQVRLRSLSSDGTPLGSSREIVMPTPWPASVLFEFGVGRYAVTVGSPTDATLRLFDRDARSVLPIGHLVQPSALADVTRLEGAHQWIVVSRAMADHAIMLSAFGDDMSVQGQLAPIAPSGTVGDQTAVRIGALKTRALATWVDTDGPVHGVIVTGAPLAAASPILELPGLPPAHSEERGLSVVPFGDRLVVVVTSSLGQIDVFFVDPWSAAITGPFTIRALVGGAWATTVPERGVAAICWSERTTPDTERDDRVMMQLVRADGTWIGAPSPIALEQSDAFVACAWNGTDFVLAWFEHSDGNHLYTQRVHPTWQ